MKQMLMIYGSYARMRFEFKKMIDKLQRQNIYYQARDYENKIICWELQLTIIFQCADDMHIRGMTFNEVVFDETIRLTTEEEAFIRSRVREIKDA